VANPVQVILATGILLGLGWAAYEASRGLPPLPPTEVEQSPVAELDLSLPEVAKLPLANYVVTLERPLFKSSRSPEASSTPQVVAPRQDTSTPNIRVTAIIIRNDERSAMLESSTPPEHRLVTKGDSFAGWEITQIADHSVTVASGGREHRIELMQFPPPQTRRPSRPEKKAPVPRNSRFRRPQKPPIRATRQPNDID